jgi:hypothetical protein
MSLAGIDADSKTLPTIPACVSVGFLGVRHCGNIENNMVPIALLKMIAIRTSGFYPNPVALASDNDTVIY